MPRADYCFDQGASTKAASTRCADLAKCETDVVYGAETCILVGAYTRSERGRREDDPGLEVAEAAADERDDRDQRRRAQRRDDDHEEDLPKRHAADSEPRSEWHSASVRSCVDSRSSSAFRIRMGGVVLMIAFFRVRAWKYV